MARRRYHGKRHRPVDYRVTCFCCKRRYHPDYSEPDYDDLTEAYKEFNWESGFGNVCFKCFQLIEPRLAKVRDQVIEDVRKLRQLERLVVA